VYAYSFSPDQVLVPSLRDSNLAYCTDTGVTDAIATYARDADLLVCEATNAEDDKAEKAALHGHMTFSQAASMAKQADARELLLTHFSPSISDPLEYVKVAQAVFPNTNVAEDLMFRTLLFEEE